MKLFFSALLVLFTSTLFSLSAFAKGVYQKPEAFVQQAYEQLPPSPAVYMLNEADIAAVKEITDSKEHQQRLRYWEKDGKTVWVLNRIGKSHPITAGFVIKNNQIQKAKVLVFRESRGWEVRYKFFTKQFIDAELNEDYRLSQRIDNVSGATLSVRAMRKMARIALYLHGQVMNNKALASNRSTESNETQTPATP